MWYHTFLPFLYYTCDTEVSYHAQHRTSFKNYLQHTRDLTVSYNTLKTRKDQDLFLQECTNLRRLRLKPAHLNTKFFLKLIHQSSLLRRLDMSVGEVIQLHTTDQLTIAPSNCMVNFLETLAQSCPQLTELGLDMMLHIDSEKQFYKSFARNFMHKLTKLEWVWFRSSQVDILPWITRENNNDICDAAFPELKQLAVSICVTDMPHPWIQELVLFENCPKLEVLAWSWDPSALYGPATLDRTQDIHSFITTLCSFITNSWLKLHSISLTMTRDDHYIFEDEQVSRVLMSFRNPIRHFRLRNGNPCTKLTWQALRMHLHTIESIHISSIYISSNTGMQLSSLEIQEVLSSGQRLIDFRHKSVLDVMDVTNDMIPWPRSISSEFHYPWLCHRLQVLKINLMRHPHDHLLNFAVFSQLTKLTELRVLHLTYPGNGPEYGMDPTQYLHDPTFPECPSFDGIYSSFIEIRNHPLGKRLLLIWPGLESCHWYNL